MPNLYQAGRLLKAGRPIRHALYAALILCGVYPAQAQQPQSSCAPRERFVAHLRENYQEEPVARGITNSGSLLEVFASKGGESFTVLISLPNGMSCMAITGNSWEFAFARPEERKS